MVAEQKEWSDGVFVGFSLPYHLSSSYLTVIRSIQDLAQRSPEKSNEISENFWNLLFISFLFEDHGGRAERVENGCLEVFLDRACLVKFDNRVYFDSVVKANLSYRELVGLKGFSWEDLFLWLPVKDIVVDGQSFGIILFDIGVTHKQLSLSLFKDSPDCDPKSQETLSFTSGFSQLSSIQENRKKTNRPLDTTNTTKTK
ncbi:hypothetical protein NE237_031613 [Protea cynaroides]|uniref:Uncharacterized protein n=1 Tax=Protea cynaroides TaxID=273540 RepID=A0A9Q0L2G3_9MAGN|nr:hypothetical protein NE237_031613 [Protea cynaroides]